MIIASNKKIQDNNIIVVLVQFRSYIYVSEGKFHPLIVPMSPVWTHIVLNYIGPLNGQGIRIYQNGLQTGYDDTLVPGSYSPGDGRVAVGRVYTDDNDQHGGVDVDELLFFNQALSDDQIWDVTNMY